jgi:hypothetical protein
MRARALICGARASPATDWQPSALPATLTALVHGKARTIRQVTLAWGHYWPAQPKPNVQPEPGPVKTLSATSYVVQTSLNGRSWHTAIAVHGLPRDSVDRLRLNPLRAHYVRLRISAGNSIVTAYTNSKPVHEKLTPMLEEMTVS